MNSTPVCKLVVTTVTLAFVTSAFPRTFTVPPDSPVATVRVPDEWPVTERGETFEGNSPDHALHFLVVRPEDKKVNEAIGEVMRYVRNTGAIRLDGTSVKRESEELNGMKVHRVSWSGKNQAGEVEISFRVISVTENQLLLVAFWGSPSAEKKHHLEVTEILNSIRKTDRPLEPD
jgi:hypothetical protein